MSAPAYIQPPNRLSTSLNADTDKTQPLPVGFGTLSQAGTPALCGRCARALEADTSREQRRFQRNRLGGLIRAAQAYRYDDGTFMADDQREALLDLIADEFYERYAAGGRARAARAMRGRDGRFKS